MSLREVIEGLNLSNRVHVLSARSLDVFATLPLRRLVDQSWDLASLEKGYRAFAHHFAAFDDLSNAPSLSTADCFIVRTLLIHWFRRVTLHDPQIPAELLPGDWPGHHAYELCHRIYQLIYREAETFLAQTVGASGGALPELSPWFFQRFGGLT
jgi:phenylacetic acid degradation operon negative regulatory protein